MSLTFHLHQLDQLRVRDGVDLVQEDNQRRDTDLASQQDVLTGLRHGSIGSRDDQDSTVHLGSTSNHVLDVIGVTRAIDVSVVAVISLVLNVSSVDSDTSLALLGALVDILVSHGLGLALLRQNLGDGSSQGGLAVIDVTNGTNVHVRLGTSKGAEPSIGCIESEHLVYKMTHELVMPRKQRDGVHLPVDCFSK